MSTTVPSDRTRTFWGAQTTITTSGYTYAAIADVSLDYGYDIKKVIVTGSNLGYYGTGAFDGKFKLEGMGSPDNRWELLTTQTSGVVQTLGVSWKEQDTNAVTSGARTWTGSGKIKNFKHAWKGDDAVMFTLEGVFVTEPTVVNS